MKVRRSDHHSGRFERVVTEPEFPDYPSVVTIVSIAREIFTIQVGLKTTEKKRSLETITIDVFHTCRTTSLHHKLEHMDNT